MDFMNEMKEREASWVIYWVYLLIMVKIGGLFFYLDFIDSRYCGCRQVFIYPLIMFIFSKSNFRNQPQPRLR